MLLAVAMAVCAYFTVHAQTLQQLWQNPTNDYRVKTWWFFGYEHTTDEGITADVEALRDAVSEARQVGHSFEINISNGYCAGGRWIDADHALQSEFAEGDSTPDYSPEEVIGTNEVIDLTDSVEDNQLQWEAPEMAGQLIPSPSETGGACLHYLLNHLFHTNKIIWIYRVFSHRF